MINKHVIVRDQRAGVYFGVLKRRVGAGVVLADARHIWQWQGRLSTIDIAARGLGPGSKVTGMVERVELRDVISISICSPSAIEQISEFPQWNA